MSEATAQPNDSETLNLNFHLTYIFTIHLFFIRNRADTIQNHSKYELFIRTLVLALSGS